MSIRYWDQKGWGSIYPSTRKPQGNVLAYQEYWFRIQSRDGVGVGAARIAESKWQVVQSTLTDAAGREVLRRAFVPETNTHQEEFGVADLPNGVYFLKVNSGNQQVTLKVMKLN